ncbi:MAG: hypothetical protein ACJAWS_003011 [Oleiphilaceae bacterium]|jgi:hypothetical protein
MLAMGTKRYLSERQRTASCKLKAILLNIPIFYLSMTDAAANTTLSD